MERMNFSPLVDDASHRDHVGVFKSLFFEKLLGFRADAVGEQGDAFEILTLGEVRHVIDQHRAIALSAVVWVDDHVLHEDDKPTARGGDGEKQVHHTEDPVMIADHENPSSVRLLEDQAQPAFLHIPIWREIPGTREKIHHQLGQRRQILDRGRLHMRWIVGDRVLIARR